MEKEEYRIEAIGYVRSKVKYRYEAPRQGVLAADSESVIKLYAGKNYSQALKGLEGFSRIWVIYRFHLNDNWKPLVTPPRNDGKRIGVFATRAPYRPNQIGISCVKLLRIDKKNIYISESDILDGSPVFDIKPYLPYSDSFPDAETGWVTTDLDKVFPVIFSAEAKKQTEWLNKKAGINLEGYASVQLSFNPFDTKRKRIKKLSGLLNEYLLAYRTWRILYQVDNKVTVTGVISGYTEDELNDINNDKYGDKSLHREYLAEGFFNK